MIKKLLLTACIASLLFASCKKDATEVPIVPILTTNSISAPAGFKWENSRNLNVSVSTTDNSFPGKMSVVAIYASDPASGGKLLTKGSVTSTAKFKSKINLSNQITELYIIFLAPDKTITTKKVQAGITDLDINMGS